MHKTLLVTPPQRSSSIRLRKRRDEVKQQFVKNRRSGEFGYRLSSDSREITEDDHSVTTNNKVDTLDPGPATGSIQHNLRPLLRKEYNTRQCGFKDTSSEEIDARCYTDRYKLLDLNIFLGSTKSFVFI